MPNKSGIYQIECLPTGRLYVGSSVNIKERWRSHKSALRSDVYDHRSRFMQRAWNKYGEAAFEFTVLEFCAVDVLLEREQYYLDTLNPSFNSCKFAGHTLGYKHRPESIKRMREVQSRPRIIRPESRELWSKAVQRRVEENLRLYGTKYNPESLHKLVSATKKVHDKNREIHGSAFTPEWKENLTASRAETFASRRENTGYAFKEETRQKMSEAHKGIRLPDEVIARAQAARKATIDKMIAEGKPYPGSDRIHSLDERMRRSETLAKTNADRKSRGEKTTGRKAADTRAIKIAEMIAKGEKTPQEKMKETKALRIAEAKAAGLPTPGEKMAAKMRAENERRIALGLPTTHEVAGKKRSENRRKKLEKEKPS